MIALIEQAPTTALSWAAMGPPRTTHYRLDS